MKRYIKTGLILFILIFTVILSETIYANSDCTYPIFFDNKVVSKDAVPSILIDDKTYVPLRNICSLLNYNVIWNEKDMRTVNGSISIFPINTDKEKDFIINEVPVPYFYHTVSIDSKTYMSVKDMCDIFGFNLNETEEEIRIDTPDEIKDNYNINKETALSLADAYFMQEKGQEFMDKSRILKIEENENSYAICRGPKELILGGDFTIYISKKDARILDVLVGE